MIKLKGVNNNNTEFSALLFGHELPAAVKALGGITDDDLIEVYGDFFAHLYRGEVEVEVAEVSIRIKDQVIDIMDLVHIPDLEYKIYGNLDFNAILEGEAEEL